MSRSHTRIGVIAVFAALCGCLFMSSLAYASNTAPAASFTVSPASLSLKVSDEATTQSQTITITNQYAAEIHLSAELYGIDENAVRIIPTGKPSAAVLGAITLSETELFLPAHGYTTLTVTANDSAALADGGHYAALVLSEKNDAPASSVFRSAASIPLFLVKDQNIRTNLQFVSSSLSHNLFTLPKSGKVTLQNLGNSHVTPRGSVSIYAGETMVGKGVINAESRVLLPGKKAEFSVNIERYSQLMLPHKLRAQTMYRIDGSDVELMKQSFFWYVPIVDVFGLVLIAGAIYEAVRHRRTLYRLLFRAFRKLKAMLLRRPSTVPAVMQPPATSDIPMQRTLGQVVIEVEQATVATDVEPVVQQPIIAPPVVQASTTTPAPHHITVVSIEDTPARPKQVRKPRSSTGTSKTKTVQATSKQPKKATANPSKKTTKSAAKPRTTSRPAKSTKTPKTPRSKAKS